MIKQYVKDNNIVLPDTHGEDNRCPALDADNKCLIYPVRPTICRLWGTALLLPFKSKGKNISIACTEYFGVNVGYEGDAEYNHYLRLYIRSLNALKRPYFLGFTYREFIQDKINRGVIK
jgi:Fe-S-cluster containining protein